MFALFGMILAPTIGALVVAHKWGAAIAAYFVFSSIVDGMPTPAADSSVAYRWLYGLLHAAAANSVSAIRALAPRMAAILPTISR